MKNFKNFMVYFLFTFSVLFVFLNLDKAINLTVVHLIIYLVFFSLSLFLLYKILYKWNIKKKPYHLWISIFIIIFYLLPIWTTSFTQTSGIINDCEYYDKSTSLVFLWETIKKVENKEIAPVEYSNMVFQYACSGNDVLMVIPFIVNPNISNKYWQSYIENKILSSNNFYISEPLLIDKYILNKWFLDVAIDSTKLVYIALNDIIKKTD